MAVRAQDLRGVIAALVTPFDEQEEIDVGALRTITSYALDNGVHGVMTTGGTGEFPSLTRDEKARVISTVVKEVAGRVPVIAGTASSSTRETIELSRDAEKAGADAVIVTAPYYFPLPEASLHDHYRSVASACGIPLIVYNNPAYTGNGLSPSLLLSLLELPNIVGLKQSDSNLGDLVELLSRSAGHSLCTGIDSQFLPALAVGASGIYSTAAGVIPSHVVRIYDDFTAGRHVDAQTSHLRIQKLNRFLEYEPGYVGPCKEALRLLGLPAGHVRRPLPDVTVQESREIRQALLEIGLDVQAASMREV